jgi:hypothetical protein
MPMPINQSSIQSKCVQDQRTSSSSVTCNSRGTVQKTNKQTNTPVLKGYFTKRSSLSTDIVHGGPALFFIVNCKIIIIMTTRKRRLPKRDEHQTTPPWHPVVILMVLAVVDTTAIRLMGQLLRGCSSMENNNRPTMGICAAVCGCNFIPQKYQ